ncbi:hypothetical protein Pedsa_1510 [Pseudopedobacter saltans DSM 12145]|uniref:Uncharacterized protein n=1 Tax=Pseudopedobacter saltans (strain ATCC 51119 / DSM 12145 / JCM 21818 / CCUG 39354 / LMG 10337 / NBRC 100064 / NCIMB 13643) TaxID=762903 RepID=F0S5C6_PSESL|nr:hypothetical protein [Pseudopedobacter saltans]ADY52071.1 hypothetical protein Pedsa_1510 [Pseudopedobacter saltans DSM 12145]
MKRLLFLIAGVIILGFTSCQKDVNNYYTVTNKTIYAERSGSQWTLVDGGKTFVSSIPLYETDNFYNDYDGILVYISYDNKVWEQIPHTYLGIAYSFDTSNSDIQVRMQYSDYTQITGGGPGRVYFKIVLIPSEQ